MEAADDSEEGRDPTRGPIAYGAGFHTKTYPVYQAHQTRSQWLAPHSSTATIMTTAYWMFQVFSTFSSSALAAAARAGLAAYQSVTGTEQVSGSSQGCQDCPRGV